MIGAFDLDDLGPLGEGARGLDRHHHALGAGIGEADLLDRGQAFDQQFRQLDLAQRRRAEGGAERNLIDRRGGDVGMSVAVDQRSEVVDAVVVDIASTSQIRQPSPRAA